MKHHLYTARTADLVPGFKGETCDFTFRPVEDMNPDQLASYEALREDIIENGIRNPVITYRGHVLIGMRRWMIARELGIDDLESCEIDENMGQWRLHDVRRLKRWLAESGIYED